MADEVQLTDTQENDEKVPDSWFWIKGSDGNASVTTTLLAISFVVVTIVYVLSMFNNIGPVQIRAFDVGACAAYFTPILTGYVTRRWTEAKYSA